MAEAGDGGIIVGMDMDAQAVVSPLIDITDFKDIEIIVPGNPLTGDQVAKLRAAWFEQFGVTRPDGVTVLRPPPWRDRTPRT